MRFSFISSHSLSISVFPVESVRSSHQIEESSSVLLIPEPHYKLSDKDYAVKEVQSLNKMKDHKGEEDTCYVTRVTQSP